MWSLTCFQFVKPGRHVLHDVKKLLHVPKLGDVSGSLLSCCLLLDCHLISQQRACGRIVAACHQVCLPSCPGPVPWSTALAAVVSEHDQHSGRPDKCARQVCQTSVPQSLSLGGQTLGGEEFTHCRLTAGSCCSGAFSSPSSLLPERSGQQELLLPACPADLL